MDERNLANTSLGPQLGDLRQRNLNVCSVAISFSIDILLSILDFSKIYFLQQRNAIDFFSFKCVCFNVLHDKFSTCISVAESRCSVFLKFIIYTPKTNCCYILSLHADELFQISFQGQTQNNRIEI